jgi:predicted HTH transcriptional regulator
MDSDTPYELFSIHDTKSQFEKLRFPKGTLPPGSDPVEAGICSSSGELTIAGALAVARLQDDSRPYLFIRYRRFDTGMAEVFDGDIRPREDLLAPGPLSVSIPELAEGLLEHAPVRPHDATLARQLFDELLVNAIGHRSFAPAHRPNPVSIEHYTDCIRISSPGPLLQGVTLNQSSLVGRRSRNPHLMALLTRQGLARQANLGQAWIARLAPELGYRVHYEVDENVVVAVLTVDPAMAVRADQRIRKEERRLRLPAGLLERRVMETLADDHVRSRKELQDQLGLPLSTISATLRRLVKLGHIETTESNPRSPKQRYRRARQEH